MLSMEGAVAQILIRNLDERVKVRLQRRAKRNGRSMEAEVREIITNATLRRRDASDRIWLGNGCTFQWERHLPR